MKLNHVANRLDSRYFEIVVEMLKVKLGFVELRRTERAIWLRQPGANVDLQFSRSQSAHRDADKLRSQGCSTLYSESAMQQGLRI
jgi:hypothetical protein